MAPKPLVENQPEENIQSSNNKKSNKAMDLKGMLEVLKKEYTETFYEIIVPEGKIAKASGYFTSETLNRQYILEHKIAIISKQLGEDPDWCNRSKSEFLSKYQQSKSKQRSQVGCIAAFILIALIISIVETYSYSTSSEQIDAFEKMMDAAKEANESGDVLRAIKLYSEAEHDYSATWRKDEYKEKARKSAEELSSIIYKDYRLKIDSAIYDTQIIEAAYIVKTMPQELVLGGNDLKHYNSTAKSIEDLMESSMKEEIEKLIISISKNRRLTESDKQRIEILTKVAPDNYWLKFIIDKEL